MLQAYQGGIAHPSGYPVYLWIGKIFAVVLQNSLSTMNAVSLVMSSAALAALYCLMRRINVSPRGALMATLLFAFTPVFWQHAIIAEVYNTNAFFVIICFLLFHHWDINRTTARLALSGFFYGMTLGVYFGDILMLPALLLFIIFESVREKKEVFRRLAVLLGAIALGALGPFLYIYFRSRALPPIGTSYNPDSPLRFFLYIKAAQYSPAHFAGWKFLSARVISSIERFYTSYAFVGPVVALVGVSSFWRKRKGYALYLFCSMSIVFCYFTYYQAEDSWCMMAITYIAAAVFLGIGFDAVTSAVWKRRAFTVMFALLVIFQVTAFPSLYIVKYDNGILDEARSILSVLPENAVIFADWKIFPSLLCVQKILKKRPDVTIYEKSDPVRNYIVAGRRVSFSWRSYVDDNIRDRARPMFATSVDETIASVYRVDYNSRNRIYAILPRDETGVH